MITQVEEEVKNMFVDTLPIKYRKNNTEKTRKSNKNIVVVY